MAWDKILFHAINIFITPISFSQCLKNTFYLKEFEQIKFVFDIWYHKQYRKICFENAYGKGYIYIYIYIYIRLIKKNWNMESDKKEGMCVFILSIFLLRNF